MVDTALRPLAAPGWSPPPARDLVAILEAFEPGTALLDLEDRRVVWTSPTFAARCGVQAGDAMEAAERCLPGLSSAVSQSGSRGRRRWRVRTGPFAKQEAQLVAVRPGLSALRLIDRRHGLDDGEQAQAVQRHLEDRERLLFTSRTLSVSEMASTLAHELNQPIGAVVNVLRGMQTRLLAGQDDAAAAGTPASLRSGAALSTGLQMALEQALFAGRIIARIRDYTHSRQPQQEQLALKDVLRHAVALIDWELTRDTIDLQLDLPDAAPQVLGDPTMLQQVFVNLMRNAIEAMRACEPGKRTLKISLTPTADRRGVELQIRDSGCGLPADAEDRLFVPFQSTKPNGMGIGLNICRSFVELHQGRLWFSRNAAADGLATPGGATFHVWLPMHSDNTPRRTAPRHAALPTNTRLREQP